MSTSEIDVWECGGCGELTSVRHWLQRDGVMAHDPDAAFREAAGLDKQEPLPLGSLTSSGPSTSPAAPDGA